MEEKYVINEGKLYYYMPKELDHHIAQHLSLELDQLVETYGIREMVLDFSMTEFMDSSGIGVLIGRSKLMYFYKGNIRAMHLGDRVMRIFKAAGLQQIISMEEQ